LDDIFFLLTSLTYLLGIPFKLLTYSSTYRPFVCLPTQEHLLCSLPPTYLPTHLSTYMAPLTSLLIGQPNHSHQRWCPNKITCRYCKKLFNVFLTDIQDPNENIKLILDVGIALAFNSTTSTLMVHLMHNSWLQWIERFLKVKIFCENFLSFICKSKGMMLHKFNLLVLANYNM
jgi:hypothetical protein